MRFYASRRLLSAYFMSLNAFFPSPFPIRSRSSLTPATQWPGRFPRFYMATQVTPTEYKFHIYASQPLYGSIQSESDLFSISTILP